MSVQLRVLIVEDSDDDCILLVRALRKSGVEPVYRRVDTSKGMQAALDEESWDVITADCDMPRFDAWQALELLKKKDLDIPLIVVSGAIDENKAAALMKAGARDYVEKDSLVRLGPAIDREMRELAGRRELKRAEGLLRQSIDALLAMYQASQLLSSTLESEEIATRLLKIMQRISSLTTAVISTEDQHGRLRVWRAIGLESLWSRVRYTPEAQTALYEVLQSGEHQLLELEHPNRDGERLSTLYLPLRIRDRTLGVLEVYGPEVLAGRDMVEILISLASKAASALENARLYGELAERERRLQELVARLIEAQEKERRRVAYEVHDELTQVAVSAHQHLQAFTTYYPPESPEGKEIIGRAAGLVKRTVEESRRVIADLRPTALDDFGLSVALRQQVEVLRDDGWDIVYEEDLRDERLPAALETALYRVAQEALTNVRKHAQTLQAHVRLGREGDYVKLEIRDRGRGFDPAELVGNGPGERVGVSGMRERVALVGGKLEIDSKKGSGTSVTVSVLLKQPGLQLQRSPV